MAYTTVNKSTSYFNTKLYTGDGGTNNAQTGVGFRPDYIWVKRRSGSGNHFAADVVRGTYADGYKLIVPNDQDAEADYTYIKSLDSDGFTLGSTNTNVNGNSETYVAWNWLAGGSQGSSNTDGSINTTYTSVNTTAGFSISKYTGTGSAATVGHGLGVAPACYIIKRLDAGSSNWHMYHKSNGATKDIRPNLTNAVFTTDIFNDTSPTNSVFSIKTSVDVNASGGTYVAYCFAEKTGYSKFGHYQGNVNADGTFVYTGFKPAWILIKNTESTDEWEIYDSKRAGYNSANYHLNNSDATAESATSDRVDILSNGFKLRTGSSGPLNNNNKYIYLAFGQTLVGSNNIPCVAR